MANKNKRQLPLGRAIQQLSGFQVSLYVFLLIRVRESSVRA